MQRIQHERMDRAYVQQQASRYGLTPSKHKGQNFLFSDEHLEMIVNASGVKEGDVVIEIGPGLGTLTKHLLTRKVTLHCIELDTQASAYIQDTYGTSLTLHQSDVLQFDFAQFHAQHPTYHVVANIPYNITSPILRLLTESSYGPTTATLMIQKEVAQRITAQPGDMSILAVAVQLYGDVEFVGQVPKTVFWPQPEVDSGVIRWTRTMRWLDRLQVSQKDFFRIVKFGFAARRKKLVNTLSAGLHCSTQESEAYLTAVGISPMVRAQEVSLEQWIDLAHIVYQKK